MRKKSSINKEEEDKLVKILDTIESNPMSEEFKLPVPYKELNLFHYPKIVKKPMDLSKVRKKLATKKYSSKEQCFDDMFLIWDNCQLFNIEDSDIHRHSVLLENITHDLVIQYFDYPYKPHKQFNSQSNRNNHETATKNSSNNNIMNSEISTYDDGKDVINNVTTISPNSSCLIKNELISPLDGNINDKEILTEDESDYINETQMAYLKKEMSKLSSVGVEQVINLLN
jgi:hypothetical protein